MTFALEIQKVLRIYEILWILERFCLGV